MAEIHRLPLRVVDGSEAATPKMDVSSRVSAIFREHSDYVATIALRLLGRDAEVDDLVQEVFLETVRSIDSLRDGSAIRPWLGTITVRVAHRQLRKRRLRSWLGIDADYTYENVQATGLDPEQRSLLAQVYTALDTLNVNERVAWTLRMIEGERLDDVARLCNCSLAAAKRRIASAHAKIKRGRNHE